MSQETKITQIAERELDFIEKEFAKTEEPLSLEKLTEKLAFQKTRSQRAQEVKVYDPSCRYEVGDYIYKEYDEPLTVSSKGAEHFKEEVVLKVVNKIPYESFNCEMLEVDYSGGGTFRKHIDYMKKTKTQVLLPSNLDGAGETPQILKKEEDPRQDQLPVTERDLKKLKKNLKSALTKSSLFFNWNGYWQLKEKQVKIEEFKIKEIEDYLSKRKQSAETPELVNRFFNLKPNQKGFSLHCISLNSVLEKKHKKNFIYVSPQNWGKWHLKKTLNSFLEKLPLSAPKAKLPVFDLEEPKEPKIQRELPLKGYLTWREILSGGLKLPKGLNREFSSAREYVFTDAEAGKDYTVYYYPSHYLFLGLKAFYGSNNVPQGASLTLEMKGDNHFNFWIKKSKKKLSVLKMTYDPEEDKIETSGDEDFTFALPNKIIHLQRETLNKLFSLFDQRNSLNLEQLLVLIFKNFGVGSERRSLHYMRAYHLVDILKRTTEEDVENTLLNSPEFKKSDKKKGIFLYEEKLKVEEEKEKEVPPEIPPEVEEEEKIEAPPPQEPPQAPSQLQEERGEEMREEVPSVTPKLEIKEPEIQEEPKPPKKEKEFKKKRTKMRLETERDFRRRKGERKIIEEKIELEESEQEALIAVKAKEKKEEVEEREELKPEKKKKEYKPAVSEEPAFGLFAEKLKSALEEKKKKAKKK
jgi:hypothetical protein